MATHQNRHDTEARGSRRGVIALVLGLLLISLPAAAETDRIDFTGTQQSTGVADPGREWTSGPIQHVRDRALTGLNFPDASTGLPALGITEGTLNYNLDTRTGVGRAWGTLTIDYGDAGGIEASYQGELRPDAVPGGFLGEFRVVGHGYGDLEGAQLRVTVREFIFVGFAEVTGTLFFPGS